MCLNKAKISFALEWIQIDWRAYAISPRCIIYISLFCRFLWPFQYFKFRIINIFLLVRKAERLERLKSEINGYLLWVNRWKRHSLTQTKIIINGKYETVKEHQIRNKMSSMQKSWVWDGFSLAPEFLCVLVAFILPPLIFPMEKHQKYILHSFSHFKFCFLCIFYRFSIPIFPKELSWCLFLIIFLPYILLLCTLLQ